MNAPLPLDARIAELQAEAGRRYMDVCDLESRLIGSKHEYNIVCDELAALYWAAGSIRLAVSVPLFPLATKPAVAETA